jgi:hypothetical protein
MQPWLEMVLQTRPLLGNSFVTRDNGVARSGVLYAVRENCYVMTDETIELLGETFSMRSMPIIFIVFILLRKYEYD